jgi:hypothetical protein
MARVECCGPPKHPREQASQEHMERTTVPLLTLRGGYSLRMLWRRTASWRGGAQEGQGWF